ncbi:MAG: hypothetical protein JNG86_12760 [Verrucomicrobiaceae bacterium]|nr:hypothetical protein [Verrucomicrobiaceae bacterium]
MKPSLALPAVVFAITLTQCEKAAPPPAVAAVPKNTAKAQDEAQMKEWRDALARQAVEFDARSALMDQQLADLEKKLQMQENEALRGQLNGLKQQNDALRSQADSARKQSEAITQRLVVSAPVPAPTVPRDYSIFYERLAPHGRWLDVSGYGLCFQPRVAKTRVWRPYVDGCWAWTSLGWAWQSNEPFGWATYHYGRWIELTRHGWIWVPGSEWAPAWVAWRQSRDHVGWAPLPPERGVCGSVQRDCDSRYGLGPASYTFISTTNFIQPSYTTICHPVSYNTTIFRHTVNITQIVPCGGNGHTPMYMHHGGPPRHHIEQTCRRPVPQPQIRQVDPVAIASQPAGTPRPFTRDAIGVIELPPVGARPRLPDIPAADRIVRPQLADAFTGVPQTVRTEIQQVIAEEKSRVASADSPQPAAPGLRPALPPAPLETVLPAMVTTAASTPQTPSPVLAEVERPNTLPPATTPAVQIAPLPTTPQPLIANLPGPAVAESTSPAPTGMAVVPPVIAEMPVVVSPTETPAISVPALETTPVQPVIAESAPAAPPAIETTTAAPDPAIQQQAEAAAMAQKQSEEAARAAAEQETARQQAEAAAMAQKQSDDAARAAAQQEAQRQQAEAAAMQQRQAEEAARAAAQQEAQRQQAEAAAMQQRQAEEAARAAAAEEAQRRAAEEQMRQAQAEAQRQAEEARRAQEEAMRQAQAEAQRQAEEAARRAQEEAARRAQEEAQRQAAEAAQRAAEEAARRAAEESARQAAEAAQRAAEAARPPQP